jgi:predicted nucleic acid-binding protein
VIVDASVAFKWLFREEGADAAAALIGEDELVAPGLLLAEVGNALWKKQRRGEIIDADTLPAQLALIGSLVTIVDEGAVMPVALALAVELDHAIYDCIYLALATQRSDTLVSADERFIAKVRATAMADAVRPL